MPCVVLQRVLSDGMRYFMSTKFIFFRFKFIFMAVWIDTVSLESPYIGTGMRAASACAVLLRKNLIAMDLDPLSIRVSAINYIRLNSTTLHFHSILCPFPCKQ